MRDRRRPHSKLRSVRGHHIYTPVLTPQSVVVDLGAHLGEFASEIAQTFSCTCYAVEALPTLYERIPGNRLIKKFQYAITDANGPVRLYLSTNLEANRLSLPPREQRHASVVVNGITLESFVRQTALVSIDLLKIDIEGAELALFQSTGDELLCACKQVTIEFHDFMAELDCHRDVESIKRRLQSLGFFCIVFSHADNSDVLFINRKSCRVSSLMYVYFKYIVKYTRGFSRRLKRRNFSEI